MLGSLACLWSTFAAAASASRVGRFVVQELFSVRTTVSGAVATFATVGVPAAFLLAAPDPVPGQPPAYMAYWTLFGTSNQLLAGLTLLSVSVWLHRRGRRCWFTMAPAVFVLTITVWSLALQVNAGISSWGASGFGPAAVNALVAIALVALAAVVAVEAWSAARRGAVPTTQQVQ